MRENEALRSEKENLAKMKNAPVEDLAIRSTSEVKENELLKKHFFEKNQEIERMMAQVMDSNGEASSAQIQSLLQQKPDTLESLMKFLIYLVLHKEELTPKEGETRSHKAKQSLYELIMNDQNL